MELELGNEINISKFYDPWPKQNALHTCAAKFPLAIGGNGSGKSAFLLGEALYNCFEYPGCNTLLLRKDFPQLEKGLILDFKNTVPRGLYRYNDSKHIVTIPVRGYESKIFFGHLKSGSERDLAQYLSAAFVFIGFDELGQWSFDGWNFMVSRNRVNPGCQPSPDGHMPFCRMAGATNPLGPGYGWIKKTWVQHEPVSQLGEIRKIKNKWYSPVRDKLLLQDDEFRKKISIIDGEPFICAYDPSEYFFVHSTVMDNPAMLQKDPAYLERLMKLAPALRNKALYGDLDSIAGAYFSNFTYERNVLSLPRDHERIKWESWQPIWLGFDWGLAHHSTVYWNTRAQVQGLDGIWRSCVVTLREMAVNENDYLAVRGQHGENWNYKRFLCEEIRKRTPDEELSRCKYIFLSPERFQRTDDIEHPIAHELSDILHQLGMPRCYEANDSRVDGAVLMYNLIDSGEWLILDQCPQIISSIESRTRDEKNLEDVLKVNDILDDCYDGCRYGLCSMLKPRGKPLELLLQEKINSIQDPTAKLMYSYQHRNDADEASAPFKPKVKLPWKTRS